VKTIQGKILTVIVLGFLILSVLLCTVSIFILKDVLHSDAENLVSTRAREEAAYINDLLGKVESSVHILEAYAEQELESTKRLSKDETYRVDYTTLVGEFFYNVARNTDGISAFYVRYNPILTHNKAGFFVKKLDNGEFDDLTPTDLGLYDPSETEYVGWYYQPIAAGKSIWMKHYTNKNIDCKMISFVTPLEYTNAKGETEVFGVCGIDVDFSFFTSIIDDLVMYETGFAFLNSDDGEIYHYPERAKNNPIVANERIEAASSLRNGMNFVIRANHSDVERHTDRLILTVIIVTAAVLLVFLIISVIIIRGMIKPLKQLTHAAEELASGNTDVHCDLVTNDEIGRLATVFNSTVSKLKDYMGYINSLAYRDSLTGVKNRTAFIEAVAALNAKIKAHHAEFGILMADINGLKRANDIYGHDAGNKLIVDAIKVICNVFKHSPVFRIGGDEFAVILEGTDLHNYKALLHELDANYQKTYVEYDGNRLPIMMAYGVSVFTSGLDRDVDDVINRADQQMYAHKREFKRRNGE
jgi:diguanylate cyclase (GGDEF)-like protein